MKIPVTYTILIRTRGSQGSYTSHSGANFPFHRGERGNPLGNNVELIARGSWASRIHLENCLPSRSLSHIALTQSWKEKPNKSKANVKRDILRLLLVQSDMHSASYPFFGPVEFPGLNRSQILATGKKLFKGGIV